MINLVKSNLLAIAFICLFISCSTEESNPLEETNYEIDLSLSLETDWEMADEIVGLINDYRTSEGLSNLVKDQQYASAFAVEHTKHMISIEQVNHYNFSRRSGALINRGAIQVGENVGKGYDAAEDVVYAWLNSSSHKKIIEGSFTHAGLGILKNEKGYNYFTLLLYKME